jgi:cell division protein FtsQ
LVKTILNIISWLLIISYLVITLGFVSEKQDQVACDSLDIKIVDTTGNNFINKSEVLAMFKEKKLNLLGKPINFINMAQLESIIYQNNSVKKVEVFKNYGILSIEIEQRLPIIRIINIYNQSFYIDYDGKLMPFSPKFTARVLVANGFISDLYFKAKTIDLMTLNGIDSMKNANVINKLNTIARFIYKDKFWKSQIEQLYIDEKHEIEIVPKIGSHLILFGDIDRLAEKFRNLKVFYYEKINQAGWNKYKVINLKFKNQIVCSKI